MDWNFRSGVGPAAKNRRHFPDTCLGAGRFWRAAPELLDSGSPLNGDACHPIGGRGIDYGDDNRTVGMIWCALGCGVWMVLPEKSTENTVLEGPTLKKKNQFFILINL